MFIDNTNIKLKHLDGNVHLNEEGINLLANNYLYKINRKPSAFHSVWDWLITFSLKKQFTGYRTKPNILFSFYLYLYLVLLLILG